MDYLSPFDAFLPNVIFVVVAIGILLVSLALSGWCMQLANRICGESEVGFLRSILAVFMSAIGSTLGMAMALIFDSEASTIVCVIYGILGAALGIVTVLGQNPLRALGTYLVFSVFVSIASFATIVAMIILLPFIIPSGTAERIASHYDQLEGTQGNRSIDRVKSRMTRANEQERLHSTPSVPVVTVGISENPYAK